MVTRFQLVIVALVLIALLGYSNEHTIYKTFAALAGIAVFILFQKDRD